MEQDPHNLQRFIEAQERSYERALAEISNGRKQSHWMWYIFPQIKGLGHSSMSRFYAIQSLDEAREYLLHPVLGPRLREISEALLPLDTDDALEVMGAPDHWKLKSSMTLFDIISPDDVFARVLDKFYHGRRDARTIESVSRTEE